MSISEFQRENPCYGKCGLFTYCDSIVKVRETNPVTSLVEFDAMNIVDEAAEGVRQAELEQQYEAWIERVKARFIDDPAGLEQALTVIENLRNDGKVTALGTDIIRHQHRARIEDIQREDKIFRDFTDLRDYVDCNGPQEVKVGRFLSKRTVTVCELAGTSEYNAAQALELECTQRLGQPPTSPQ